jgi:beta-lactamase class A
METAVRSMNDLCDGYPHHVGWYLKDLRTGQTAERNGSTVVPSASTRKISILMAALKGVSEGRFQLDQPFTVEAKYQNNTSGCFLHLKPGFTITFQDALVMMIIVSDNTCTGSIVDTVGIDEINTFCQSAGMKKTTHRHNIPPGERDRDHPVESTNATTPEDVGLLLDLVLNGAEKADAAEHLGTSPDLCRLALDILSWQKFNCRLPSRLPHGTRVAHKTGTDPVHGRFLNDAGIVYRDDRPQFILTVYNDQLPPELPDGTPGTTAAVDVIGKLCRMAYDTLAL